MRILALHSCLALTCLALSPPAEVHASPSPADSVHFCAFDHEQWRPDHPRPAASRQAAKPLADLNVGEPRTVRIVYFRPSDWSYLAEVADSMKTVIRRVQTFYSDQMQAHGHGDATFRIETDAGGEPMVHRVDGRHPFSHYDNTLGNAVIAELEETFDLDANIYVIILGTDALRQSGGDPAGGVGRRRTKNGGVLVVPKDFGFFTIAHELGHAFGLYHDFRDNRYIMSYGGDERGAFSACAAEFLSVHTYFNPAVPTAYGEPPIVELISPNRYEPGSTSVPVRVQVRDPEGLHQVGLIGNEEWCRGLAGEKDAVAEFNFNGSFWQRGFTDLSDLSRHNLLVVAVDADGNVGEYWFELAETSPYEITTLRGDWDHIESVAFSPDGTLLAAGLWWGDPVMVWDLATGESFAILEQGEAPYVAFSPDGTLARTGYDGVILWDAATRREITTLPQAGSRLAFSRDGALLAVVSSDGPIALWDVRNRAAVGTLEGHTSLLDLEFSPDGTLLASGSWDLKPGDDVSVRLWDVADREEVATLARYGKGGEVGSVAFSPDGKTLASGLWPDNTVTLWDVETREAIATFEGVRAVFSPDGAVLACFSGGEIELREVGTGKEIATLANEYWSAELAFSPDGAMLAAGAWSSGTITLWDVSEWTGPRPFALEIISGNGQQGAPGGALARPLVVEVRDQFGNLLPDASVTFTVTTGEGTLSDRFAVARATTDADGRAEILLTLGPHPGLNIVAVSLGGHELAAFSAEGVGVAVAELVGDYRTWHLPAAATARLGKGALGEGDRAVALSADGRWLAVASALGVWLYEAATARALALLPTERPVHSVAFALRGTLAAGLENGRVELWEVETGQRTGALRHADRPVTVVFSPDGTHLASGSREHVIKLWDVETRRQIGRWEVTRESNSLEDIPLAFSPDGSRLIAGFHDRTVRLWDVATRTEVATLEGHTDRVTSVSFSPDGALLASAGGWNDRTIRLWDAATQAQVAILRGHENTVRSVTFSPDGGTLASGGGKLDPTVRLWDVATRTEVATLEVHGSAVHSVTFSPDGGTLVSGAAEGTVLLRDLETGNAAGLSGHESLSSMALSPDGAMLASGGYREGTVRLWDVAARTEVATLEGHADQVTSASFSPGGALLASAGGWYDKSTIKLWDVATRKLVGTLKGHTDWAASLVFSPDGAILASAGGWGDATVRLWDVGTHELLSILEGHTNSPLPSVAFSPPDGALLASAGGREDRTVKLWDVATRQLVGTLEGHEYEVNAVAFSPDGSTLASGSEDGVWLWDVATQTRIATLQDNAVYSLAFSPDGKSLLSGSWGTVRLWDLGTRRSTATFEGHLGTVRSVVFLPDGTVISAAGDGTMLLWDPRPHPRTLTNVGGRGQQGPAGAVLDQPFSVLVRDQNGSPLAGATVTFAITAGGGTLSVTNATTDAEGRAATTLTLGSEPGSNTVEAAVDGLEPVTFTATGLAVPRTLTKVSGDGQEGPAGAALPEPFVIEVRDQNGTPFAGATVTFAVTAGGGTLSVTNATTDADGRASTTLTLGRTPGPNTVTANVPGLDPVTFTATAEATPDFDGDGETGFSDFFLFADAFGGSDPRFDLDGSGSVDFGDFFLLADYFADPARGKLLTLAREMIGLPDGPQLQQNAPNPFNSGTVISWFQLEPGPVRMEVFALTGQRVAVLHQGPEKAGVRRVRWDGRDDRGRPLASGVYVYRLVTSQALLTRKLTLLR